MPSSEIHIRGNRGKGNPLLKFRFIPALIRNFAFTAIISSGGLHFRGCAASGGSSFRGAQLQGSPAPSQLLKALCQLPALGRAHNSDKAYSLDYTSTLLTVEIVSCTLCALYPCGKNSTLLQCISHCPCLQCAPFEPVYTIFLTCRRGNKRSKKSCKMRQAVDNLHGSAFLPFCIFSLISPKLLSVFSSIRFSSHRLVLSYSVAFSRIRFSTAISCSPKML